MPRVEINITNDDDDYYESYAINDSNSTVTEQLLKLVLAMVSVRRNEIEKIKDDVKAILSFLESINVE